jgi:hypothetical protein
MPLKSKIASIRLAYCFFHVLITIFPAYRNRHTEATFFRAPFARSVAHELAWDFDFKKLSEAYFRAAKAAS